jgi:hypothetical protein
MPRIVYLSWPAREISGGIKAAFQHVELLNEGGLEAIVATEDAAAPSWFETSAPVCGLGKVRADDVLVFPENSAQLLQGFASRPNAKLVFCQSPLLAWQGLGTLPSCADAGISHIMCPSHTVLHFCRSRFRGVKLGYTPFHIDPSRFACTGTKTLQIACVPRKRPNEFRAIVDLFRALYPQHRRLDWVYLHQASEAQVAKAMGQSAVFLSLARLEAHGMTALEAMASGCIVAGYSGVAGGTDTATARNGFWAAEDDLAGCVDQLARAVQLAIDRDRTYHAMVEEGRRTAHEYRREEAARRLLEFWRAVLPELARP